uniref:Uncharacterized protein n=1 Tax=Brassica oleracea var. oleracea TaxID=109376 RepID=A0A0D3ARI1_BRAOL
MCQNQPRERSLHLLRLGGRVCGPGEAKLPSDHIVEGEPNRLERSRDRSYSVFVYLGVEEQKVLKCDRVNQRGSHNKIHHTEEDLVLKRVVLNHRGGRRKSHSTDRTSESARVAANVGDKGEGLNYEVEFFRQKKDALGRLSLSPLQKCTAAIRCLAYGTAADTVDEYLRLDQHRLIFNVYFILVSIVDFPG